MFSLPPPPGVNEELDGVPIVHLTDDQKALEDLLQFIYNPLYVFADCRSSCALTSPRGAHACRSLGLKRRSSDTAVRCMGLLELGKKYEVDSVKATVAEHLKNDWPATLEEWRCQQAEIARLEEMYCNACNSAHGVDGPYLSDMFPEPVSVIMLCLKFDIREPLAAAFYQLSTTRVEDDYDRWRLDATGATWKYFAPLIWRNSSPLLHWRRTARWTILPGDLFMRVLIGRDVLAEQERRLRPGLLRSAQDCTKSAGGPGGRGPPRCADLLKRISAQTYTSKHGEPLGFLEQFDRMLAEVRSCNPLCDACRNYNSDNLEHANRRIWTALRGIFSSNSA